MPINKSAYLQLLKELEPAGVKLVAVSKSQSVDDIQSLYDLGQRDFGENYVQELLGKYKHLPADIRWHFIGHLQSNKVRSILPFVQLIQSVDSLKLLETINKEAVKLNRTLDCLAQVHIAREDTKFGMDEEELKEFFNKVSGEMKNIKISGLMGIASLTGPEEQIRMEFRNCKKWADQFLSSGPHPLKGSQIISMGMSNDYKIAIEEGSNMVRIGSLVFGERRPPYPKGG
ncbi:MAG TPA: YggS family pyridoxal phosphate-dependent enzyme [Chitinophagaceae bacterium]|nr:YggS family pyridoxal phosphate-dependent enzyme [Chitinophagaceae bacterium]